MVVSASHAIRKYIGNFKQTVVKTASFMCSKYLRRVHKFDYRLNNRVNVLAGTFLFGADNTAQHFYENS